MSRFIEKRGLSHWVALSFHEAGQVSTYLLFPLFFLDMQSGLFLHKDLANGAVGLTYDVDA